MFYRGRFSTVKKCINIKTGDRVAAKVISCQHQPYSVVEHECQILKGLRHRGVLELLECYRTPTSCILVFPFVDGLRLFDHVCLRWSSYSEHSVCTYIRQLMSALDYLHLHGIAHLDIKPENLLVEECSEVLKLVDFGDARRVLAAPCKLTLVGNPEFAAPEIIKHGSVTTRADLWSSGVLLYALLAGSSPFLGDSDEITCVNIKTASYAFPDLPKLSELAHDLISRLLVADPHKRPSASSTLAHLWMKATSVEPLISSSLLVAFVNRRDQMV
ncbi:unnamed protein product, partial [Ixodes hexagonus]